MYKKSKIGTNIALYKTVPSSLANGAFGGVTFITGMNFFDSMSFFAKNLLLPLSALLVSVFIGWVWGPKNAINEATNGGTVKFGLANVWAFSVKFLAPIAIGYILLQSIMTLF